MSDNVSRIKEKLSIVDVVAQYVKLEKAGGIMRARCPFHGERTPSFHVSLERGTYHCFGCGVGGDIFTFIQAIEGVDFRGALKLLADKAGIELAFDKAEKKDEKGRLFELMEAVTIFYTSKLTPEAHEYLTNRGLTEATIRSFRIGFAGNSWSEASDFLKAKGFAEHEIIAAGIGKPNERGGVTDKFRNRIMFPIGDTVGRIVGFSGRTFGPHASPEAPKYLNSPETPLFHKSHILYGMDRAKTAMRTLQCAVLVEGQMDLIMSHQAGWNNTVAASGTALTPEQAQLIKRMTDNLVIALDADMAGIKAAGRGARAALAVGLTVKVAALPSEKDPADLILKEGNDAWKNVIKNATDVITFLLDTLETHIPQKNRFYTAVAQVVLPFVREVASPTQRHRYIVEVARKTGATEAAVEEEIARLPAVENTDYQESAKDGKGEMKNVFGMDKNASTLDARIKNLFSILMWQERAGVPVIDVTVLARELEDIAGSERMQVLRALGESELEVLRFAAESTYGTSKQPQKECDAMIRASKIEVLNRKLAEAGADLKRAEGRGDEAETERLMRECQSLAKRIADLHKIG